MRVTFQSWARTIAGLAGPQLGHVTRRQLLGRGIPGSAIDAWIRGGLLVRVFQGVYAVGYRRVEPVAMAMAAVLACGDGALLGHDSTLALHGMRRWPRFPEVSVPRRVRRRGILTHHTTTLTRSDRSLWLGVPTTRVARAIADMGPRLTERQRIRLTNDARLRNLLSVDEQFALLGHDRNATRSGGEDAVQGWITRAGLPQPLINADVNGHEADAHWPQARVILQLDHHGTHSDPRTFVTDRETDRHQLEHGQVTVRLTVQDLTDAEAERLRRLLRERSPDPPGC